MSIVYFAQDRDRIKIGYSSRSDADARLKEIGAQGGLKLDLIGFTKGTLQEEKALHYVLKDHRIRGEWYRDSAELRHIIDRCLTDLAEAIRNPDGRTTPFAKVIHAIWPDDPAGVLAERANCSRMQAFLWLADMEELPAYLVAVLMRELIPPWKPMAGKS